MKAQFPIIRKRFPQIAVTEIAKVIARHWSELSDAQRAPYDELAAQDSKRYYEEKSEFETTLPPKRPLSAYTFFVMEEREKILKQNASLTFAEVGRELGRR